MSRKGELLHPVLQLGVVRRARALAVLDGEVVCFDGKAGRESMS
jgi:hypothetical protein